MANHKCCTGFCGLKPADSLWKFTINVIRTLHTGDACYLHIYRFCRGNFMLVFCALQIGEEGVGSGGKVMCVGICAGCRNKVTYYILVFKHGGNWATFCLKLKLNLYLRGWCHTTDHSNSIFAKNCKYGIRIYFKKNCKCWSADHSKTIFGFRYTYAIWMNILSAYCKNASGRCGPKRDSLYQDSVARWNSGSPNPFYSDMESNGTRECLVGQYRAFS